MHQAFDTWLELGECAELRELCDLGRHRIADVVLLLYTGPGILLDLLEAQRDLLVLAIDTDDANVDFLAHAQHLGWMLDLTPRQLRQVDQPISTTEIHEGAEVGQRRYTPMADLASPQLGQQPILLLCSPLP